MRCPKCGNETRVLETRGQFRKRGCKGCGTQFETRVNLLTGIELRRQRAGITPAPNQPAADRPAESRQRASRVEQELPA